MTTNQKDRMIEYEIVQNEQDELTKLGKQQYIQETNKNNFNKLYQDLSQIINEIDIKIPEVSYKKCNNDEINDFLKDEQINKLKQPLNYSFKFNNKLFLQLLIFNKMSQHIIYSNQIESEQNKIHVDDLQEQIEQDTKEIDDLERQIENIKNEKNKRIIKLREKCKEKNNQIFRYRISLLFLLYTSIYSFYHFYDTCFYILDEFTYPIVNYFIYNLSTITTFFIIILNEYNIGFVIIGILITIIYNKIFG